MRKWHFNLRRSWHCRRLFFRELRKSNSGITPTSTVEAGTEPKQPLSKTAKITIIVFIVVIILAPIIVIISINATAKKHDHIYSSIGTSTSTCSYLGETTYYCIYHNDDYYKCNEKKVIKDTEYKAHAYQVIETISDKIEKSTYLSQCKWCKAQKTEAVTHSIYKYKSSLSNYGVIGIDNTKVEKSQNQFSYECLFYTKDSIPSARDTNYFIILKLYDNQDDLYAIYYMRAHILPTKRCYHHFKIKDSAHREKYFDHRWELSSLPPKNAIELKYYD